MLVRLLLLGFLVWIGLRAYKAWQLQQQQRSVWRQPQPEQFEPMVQCRRCGVHLPASAVSPVGLCGKCAG